MKLEGHFSLDELAALVEMPKRRIRFYIQCGLVNRPCGDSPRTAFYTMEHLEQLLFVRKWQRAGVSLERIRELLTGGHDEGLRQKPRGSGDVEVWSRLIVSDGVELHLEPSRAGLSPEQVQSLFRTIMDAYECVQNPGVEQNE